MIGRLMTAREVAEIVGVHAETVLRWYRQGDIPAVLMPGGAIRFREDEFEAWLAARSTWVQAVPCAAAADGRTIAAPLSSGPRAASTTGGPTPGGKS